MTSGRGESCFKCGNAIKGIGHYLEGEWYCTNCVSITPPRTRKKMEVLTDEQRAFLGIRGGDE